MHAKLRAETLQRELDRLALAGNTQDLARVLEACPCRASCSTPSAASASSTAPSRSG
jgi:hypothetical protein